MAVDPERLALQQKLARDINCLSDADRFKRKRGIDALTKELFDSKNVGYFMYSLVCLIIYAII